MQIDADQKKKPEKIIQRLFTVKSLWISISFGLGVFYSMSIIALAFMLQSFSLASLSSRAM